jgi:predicted LPLAT superfamily acyltransferase
MAESAMTPAGEPAPGASAGRGDSRDPAPANRLALSGSAAGSDAQREPLERASGWAGRRERGAYFMMRATLFGLRLLGRPVMLPIVHLVVLYFFLFSRGSREASLDYLRRVQAAVPESGLTPTWRHAYRHFREFATAILDKIDTWFGRMKLKDVSFEERGEMARLAHQPRGIVAIGSHLGNLEILRGLGTLGSRVKLNVLVHTKHADYFNRILKVAGASDVELVQVTALDPTTAFALRERLDRGEWVVITGDRVPVHGGRTVEVDFLGGRAPLPIGPYIIAGLLQCPVHLLFCLRHGGRNHAYFEPFAERIEWTRSTRDAVLAEAAQRFASRLEHYVRKAPLQWFNFYRFWQA